MPKHKESSTNDDDKPAFEDAGLGFVYKSLISRDPNKRRIKPVESILSYDLADLDESESDDSDYNPGHANEDDVDGESDCEIGDKGTKKGESEQNGNHEDSSEADDSDESIDEEDEEEINIDLDNESSALDTTSITNNTLAKTEQLLGSSSQPTATNGLDGVSNDVESKKESFQVQQARLKKVIVCCVCLGDVSRNDDEIVECDSCGISVHELCYGITADDAESIHSDASSASTEPWFCDPCKSGIRNPLCELCPNLGGIYKITETGRWVHMVCALYTGGITFADAERLRGPALNNINFSRWGSKPCSLCEDERYNQTGVAICCDAGMCKNFFHATCAQREGLLCSAQSEEVDPFFAYCKMHSDKQAAKLKRRNYLALQAKNRMLSRDHHPNGSIEDSITSQRTLSKLNSQRQKFIKNFQQMGNQIVREKRFPKMLNSSPTVLRRLNNKGSLLGINIPRLQQKLALDSIIDIRRKWYIQPAFSVEFVSYYMDRAERITSIKKQSEELNTQNNRLKEAEAKIRSKYDEVFAVSEKLKNENELKRAKIRRLLSILCSFAKETDQDSEGTSAAKAVSSESDEEQQIKRLKIGRAILALPEMQTVKPKPETSPSSADNWSNGYSSNLKSSNGKSKSKLGKSVVTDEAILLKSCATCSLTKDQHTLALCDRCHLHYHLYCLDPPLRRMPKKTRFGGWMCSNCYEKDQEEEELIESALERAESASTPSVAESPSTAPTESGTSSRGGTRKLRENPKSAVKYEDELNSQMAIYPGGGLSGGNPNNSRARSRARSGSTSNGNASSSGRRVRKGKTTSSEEAAAKSTPPPTVEAKSRKRKRDKSVDNSSSKDEDESILSPEESVSADTSTEPTSSSNVPTATLPLVADEDDEVVILPTSKSSSSASKRPAPAEVCNGCKEEAQPKQSVRCDCCMNLFHFGCLKPPLTKTPKRRGYTWCCFICEKIAEKRDHSHSHHSTDTAEKSKSVSEKANVHSEQQSKTSDTTDVGSSALKDTVSPSKEKVLEEASGDKKDESITAEKGKKQTEKALRNGTLEKDANDLADTSVAKLAAKAVEGAQPEMASAKETTSAVVEIEETEKSSTSNGE